MGLKSLIEMLTVDNVAEFIGTTFFIGVLVWFFFGGGAAELVDAWSTTVCG